MAGSVAARVLGPDALRLDSDVLAYIEGLVTDSDIGSADDVAAMLEAYMPAGASTAVLMQRILDVRQAQAKRGQQEQQRHEETKPRQRRRQRSARQQRQRATAPPPPSAAATEATPAASSSSSSSSSGSGGTGADTDDADLVARVLDEDDVAAAAELGASLLLPSNDAAAIAALVALVPGVSDGSVGRFLRVFGGDSARCAEWLLETVTLTPSAAARLARDIAADPAAASAGTRGVGLASSLPSSPSSTATMPAEEGEAGGIASVEAGGIASVEAAEKELLAYLGRREARRLRAEAAAGEREAGVKDRVLQRFDEVEEDLERKARRRGKGNGSGGSRDSGAAGRRRRRKEQARVIKFRDGRPFVVREGDRFVDY